MRLAVTQLNFPNSDEIINNALVLLLSPSIDHTRVTRVHVRPSHRLLQFRV